MDSMNSFKSFLVTGATDGIGLFTVRQLAKTAPKGSTRLICIHGRSKNKLEAAQQAVLKDAQAAGTQVEVRLYQCDLSSASQVTAMATQLEKDFKNKDLDCLVNNAAVIDGNGPSKSECGKYEKTFMVNVLAPFILTKRALETFQPKRIVLVSSGANSSSSKHSNGLKYDQLQYEKGGWDYWGSYCLSKLLLNMFVSGLYFKGQLPASTTMLTLCPGMVNTKMLTTHWGHCGKNLDRAVDTFTLSTKVDFENPGGKPKYYSNLKEATQAALADSEKDCVQFVDYLTKLSLNI